MSRYRNTFSDLLNEVRIVEQMKTIKLRNGAKVLDKTFSNVLKCFLPSNKSYCISSI